MKLNFWLIPLLILLSAFTYQNDKKNMNNPFFKQFDTPFQTPPFDLIKNEHYLPAFEAGIKEHDNEIKAIVNNKAKPTFENTIESFEKSGQLLTRVSSVFFNILSANTSDEIQKISNTLTPMLSKHNSDVSFNVKLFKRIKTLYDNKKSLNLSAEQENLLKNYYLGFVRSGVNLSADKKEILRKTNEELDLLGLKFSENILKENSAFKLVIDKKEDLAGLPESVIQSASEAAKEKGYEGKWLITLNKPSFIPFLTYAENRTLREKVYKAYINRGDNGNENDNKKILARIASLRVNRANLVGYKTHANYILEKSMSKTPENVFKFLNDLWTPALQKAKGEVAEMQQIIDKEGKNFKLAGWDWWYYAEKLKKEKYDLDEEMLRPYFKLENVRNGAFAVATKLYGIQFIEKTDISLYHPEVKVFEVKEANGKHLGILYTDYFPRDSKQSGAWCGGYRSQSDIGGKFITPLVCNVGNFSKPVGGKPALLSLEDVKTLFHEFGHALNALFSNNTYPGVGNNVEGDFVELPSQVMENWATEPAVLKEYAKHYQSGETIPDELIAKIRKSQLFNQGFMTVEYLAASFLDMDWHSIADNKERDPQTFENEALSKLGLISEIAPRYRSTNFLHIFGGGDGYSAGYYDYIWAEVLSADAFAAFSEKGLFDQELAASFRNFVLAKTGSANAMELYKKFRGREPKVDALLKSRGLN